MPWGVVSAIGLYKHFEPKTPAEITEYYKRFSERLAEQKREWRELERLRLIEQRGERMSTRLERRRRAIRAKWWARARALAALIIGLPITIAAVALMWRFATWAVAM